MFKDSGGAITPIPQIKNLQNLNQDMSCSDNKSNIATNTDREAAAKQYIQKNFGYDINEIFNQKDDSTTKSLEPHLTMSK